MQPMGGDSLIYLTSSCCCLSVCYLDMDILISKASKGGHLTVLCLSVKFWKFLLFVVLAFGRRFQGRLITLFLPSRLFCQSNVVSHFVVLITITNVSWVVHYHCGYEYLIKRCLWWCLTNVSG